MRTIIHWILRALAVMITAFLLPGVVVKGAFTALVVAVVLGFLNTIIRPILIILTLPVQIFTLGLFTVAINAFLVYFTSSLVPGFSVNGFFTAVLFSLILSLVNMVLHSVDPEK